MDNQDNNIFPKPNIDDTEQTRESGVRKNMEIKNIKSKIITLPLEYNNYPMPNRKDLMSQRGLDASDFPITKFKQLSTKRDFSLNNYSLDIEGSAPRSNSIFTNKIDYTLKNEDIEKSSPTNLIADLINKPILNLNNRDIEGTIPRGHHCFKSTRHTNPLNPEYPLPSCGIKYPLEKPKFLRDTLDIRDIPGATKNRHKICYTEHNYIDVYNRKRDDDILISHQKLFKGNRNKLYNSMDYRDVYKRKPFSNRHTNPLEPRYNYPITEIPSLYGEIEGNKPVVFSKFNSEKYGKGLKTNDIEGAQSNTKSSYSQFILKHKHPIKKEVEDIIGSHHGSLQKSIVTKRNTNPLEPKYKFLGDKKLEFDEYNQKLRSKFDYSSLYDFYKNHSKIALKQQNEELNQSKSSNKDNKNNNIDEMITKKENETEPKYIKKDIVKIEPKEDKNKKYGEEFIHMIKEREKNPKDEWIESKNNNNDFPDINELPRFFEQDNKKSVYQKPEIFYPLYHDKFIIPSNPNNQSGRDISIKVLKDIQNNYENAKNNKILKINPTTYESKLDEFIHRYPGSK